MKEKSIYDVMNAARELAEQLKLSIESYESEPDDYKDRDRIIGALCYRFIEVQKDLNIYEYLLKTGGQKQEEVAEELFRKL